MYKRSPPRCVKEGCTWCALWSSHVVSWCFSTVISPPSLSRMHLYPGQVSEQCGVTHTGGSFSVEVRLKCAVKGLN